MVYGTLAIVLGSVSGILFCADVGQNKLEEVNLIEKGGNYGWSSYEGSHLFELNDYSDEAQQVIKPIFEYSHDYGTSITGGFLYIEGKSITKSKVNISLATGVQVNVGH